MQRSPADPYAADTAASAAMSISASGSTIMWFFAPPSAWQRCGSRSRSRRTTRRRSPNARARRRQHFVAVHGVEHAVREAGFLQNSAVRRTRTILLRRLQHERAPHAIAAPTSTGNHRQLNGVMPATTPSGCRSVHVDAGRRLLGETRTSTASEGRRALDHLSPRVTSPVASDSTLPPGREDAPFHRGARARARGCEEDSARFASETCAT